MSDYLFRLEVPADKRSFTVGEALDAMSLAIHPDPKIDEPVTIRSIERARLDPLSGAPVGLPIELSEADWDVLRAIWSRLDAPKFPMPADRWKTYADTFNASRNKPQDWGLTPLQSDPSLRRAILRAAARTDHRAVLKQAIARGDITPRNPLTGAEESGWLASGDEWLLTRTHMKTFCDLLAVELVDGPPHIATSVRPVNATPMAAGKRWTVQELESLRLYRAEHGTKAAAARFGISEQRVRELLPGEKQARKGFSAFNRRQR